MDHGAFMLPNSVLGSFLDTDMDLDFMDDPSQYLPFMDSGHLIANSHYQIYQEETEYFPESSPLVSPEIEEEVVETTTPLAQSDIFLQETGELDKRWCITSFSVKTRLLLAIGYLKEYVEDRDVLVQVWVPTQKDGKYVLTTIDQPYSVNPNCKSLASYRDVSKTFHFPAGEGSKESAGLPGRVFLGMLPEWTPDVRFFRNDECPRKNFAKMYNISGCLALPVFERGGGTCLAVVEIVTTTQKISYQLEIEIICKALEAVDLESSQDFRPSGVKACNEVYQVAIPEISEVLQSVCRTYRLPLALTWALRVREGERGCQQFAKKMNDCCISTVDSACVVADKDFLGFQAACSEQYLFLDQGIVGKAFTRKKQCFATDVTSFSRANYPLCHHARMFNLHAAVAIPLRSIYTGSVEFVLELFLPKDCQDIEEQKWMQNILSIVIQQACRSFHVIMDKELEEEVVSQMEIASKGRHSEEGTQKLVSSSEKKTSLVETSWFPYVAEDQKNGKLAFVSWECQKEEPEEEDFKVTTHWDIELDLHHNQDFLEFRELQQNSRTKRSLMGGGDSCVGQRNTVSSRKAGEKKRTKPEKMVSLQVIQKYFSGSLKDAAKNIGVCPTTLKRICRQHGISRWPSRKIKKVGHSLKKLQLLLDSVEGAKGVIQIDSFYTSFPELSSPISGNAPFSSCKVTEHSKVLNQKSEHHLFDSEGSDLKSQSSSSSQNSGSTIFCSSEAKQHSSTINGFRTGHALEVEDPVSEPKRTCSQAELHSLNQEELKLLARLQSHKTSGGHQSNKTPLPLPKIGSQGLQDGGAFRVKATFGKENVRFSLHPNWGFRNLQQEIATRFNIGDFSRIDLKYLDNDREPVLLTCDADLEECKDLFRFSQGHTIKIFLHQASGGLF